jgi:hypothetical protein
MGGKYMGIARIRTAYKVLSESTKVRDQLEVPCVDEGSKNNGLDYLRNFSTSSEIDCELELLKKVSSS